VPVCCPTMRAVEPEAGVRAPEQPAVAAGVTAPPGWPRTTMSTRMAALDATAAAFENHLVPLA
jgi:hypothetical protein